MVELLGLRPRCWVSISSDKAVPARFPIGRWRVRCFRRNQCDHVLSICVEVCSAAMYLDDDPGVLISACLFGDGAGAAVCRDTRHRVAGGCEWKETASLTNPAARESLRFQASCRHAAKRVDPPGPDLGGGARRDRIGRCTRPAPGLTRHQIDGWIFHAGGRDVLLALAQRFGLTPEALTHSREALREYGNLSSAFVYFVLDAALNADAAGGWWWMSSFGAGFTCHGALLAVE